MAYRKTKKRERGKPRPWNRRKPTKWTEENLDDEIKKKTRKTRGKVKNRRGKEENLDEGGADGIV